MITENLATLKINNLSKKQFEREKEAGRIDQTAIYLTPDDVVEDDSYPGCYYRVVDNKREWINPPLLYGVEYRTIERHNNKNVYVKKMSIDALPSSKGVTLQIHSDVKGVEDVVDVGCTITNGTYGAKLPMISIGGEVLAWLIEYTFNGGQPYAYIETAKDMSSYSGIITWKYTKSSN